MSEVPQDRSLDNNDCSSTLKLLYSPKRTGELISQKEVCNPMNQDSTETELGASDSETSGIYFPYSKIDEEMLLVCNYSNLSVNDSLMHSCSENSVEVEDIIRQGCREFTSGCHSPKFHRSPYLLRSSRTSSPIAGPSREDPHQVYYDNEDLIQNRIRRQTMIPSDFKTNFPIVDFRRRKFMSEDFSTDNNLAILHECDETNKSIAREETEKECSISVNDVAKASGHSYINRHSEEREETHSKNQELSCDAERAIPTTSSKNDHIENSGELETHTTDENSLRNNHGKYQEGVSDQKGLSINLCIPKELKNIPIKINIIEEPSSPVRLPVQDTAELADNVGDRTYHSTSSSPSVTNNDRTVIVSDNLLDNSVTEGSSCGERPVSYDFTPVPIGETVNKGEIQVNPEPGPSNIRALPEEHKTELPVEKKTELHEEHQNEVPEEQKNELPEEQKNDGDGTATKAGGKKKPAAKKGKQVVARVKRPIKHQRARKPKSGGPQNSNIQEAAGRNENHTNQVQNTPVRETSEKQNLKVKFLPAKKQSGDDSTQMSKMTHKQKVKPRAKSSHAPIPRNNDSTEDSDESTSDDDCCICQGLVCNADSFSDVCTCGNCTTSSSSSCSCSSCCSTSS